MNGLVAALDKIKNSTLCKPTILVSHNLFTELEKESDY